MGLCRRSVDRAQRRLRSPRDRAHWRPLQDASAARQPARMLIRSPVSGRPPASASRSSGRWAHSTRVCGANAACRGVMVRCWWQWRGANVASRVFTSSRACSTKRRLDRHRAFVSLVEELEAIDWYEPRVRATKDLSSPRFLAHNRDDEKAHAAIRSSGSAARTRRSTSSCGCTCSRPVRSSPSRTTARLRFAPPPSSASLVSVACAVSYDPIIYSESGADHPAAWGAIERT